MRVQTESGEPREADVYVPFEAIPFDEKKYPVLGSVAPYYDTVFNPSQCARLVAEWDLAGMEQPYAKQAQEWKLVRDAAARCASEDLYLKFIGD